MSRTARRLAFAALVFAVAGQTTPARPADSKPKSDAELIQGPWSVVGLETGGKAEPEKAFRGNTFTFTRDKGVDRAVLKEWAYPSLEYSFALDPAKTPKVIDLTTTKGGHVVRGIYKLEGDELTLCVSMGGARPTEFATKAGGDTETFTLRRLKWEKYTDKEAGFAFEVPGKPEERSRMADTPAGPVTTTIVTARNDNDRVTYLVTSAALPAKPDAKATEAALDAALKVVVAEVDKGAKATTEPEPRFKQPPGVSAAREYVGTLELPDAKDKAWMRVRLYVAGDRVYALAVFGQEEGTRSANVGRFWGSFRLPGDKRDRDPPSKQ